MSVWENTPYRRKLGHRVIGQGCKPLLIAEIGINHGGCVDKALAMIQRATACGADVVKFQCHIPGEEMSEAHAREVFPENASGASIWEVIESATLTEAEDARCKAAVEAFGATYMSTPFSVAAVERLERLGVVAYKVGSGETTHWPLLRAVKLTGKPWIASTGMLSESQVNAFKDKWGPDFTLQCTSKYPTPLDEVRLNHYYGHTHTFQGYSDHTVGIAAPLAAIARGAYIVEKHFTLTHSDRGPDVEVSMTPNELWNLRRLGDEMSTIRHPTEVPEVLHAERQVERFARQSVYAKSDIPKGTRLSVDLVDVKRPRVEGTMDCEDLVYAIEQEALTDVDIEAGRPLRFGDWV